MKYIDLLKWGEQQLQQGEVPNGKTDAWILFEYVFEMDRAKYFLVMNQEIELSEEVIYGEIIAKKIERYKKYINLRLHRIPVQYITHEQNFMGYSFYVNEYVLIPRQDTEVLVEYVWNNIKQRYEAGQRMIHILDMCTGSGCIAISLWKMCEETYPDMKLKIIGVDKSAEALQVAKYNGHNLTKDAIVFVESDLFKELKKETLKQNFADMNETDEINYQFDIIVSNPPYIPTEYIEMLEQEVKCHEPFIALDGTEDGLFFYEGITTCAKDYLKDGGILAYEIGYDQGEKVSGIMEDAGFLNVKVMRDLAGLDRVVYGQKE